MILAKIPFILLLHLLRIFCKFFVNCVFIFLCQFIVFFYNNIWDAEFLANFDFKNHFNNEDFVLKVEKIKFLDFEYLNTFFYNYAKDKVLSLDGEFDIHNIRNDFFVLLETEELAIAVGGNEMDFFFNDLKLDDDSLKELSNQWILYFLK